MTAKQADMMKHALGYGRGVPGWRNHYCIGRGTPDAEEWETLVGVGLAKFGALINGGRDWIFHVTDAGKAAIATPESR